jgi:hypothetical protein
MIVESEYEALKRQAIEGCPSDSGGFLELLRDEVKRLPKLATDRPWMPARNKKAWVAFDGGVNRRLNSGVLVDFSTPASRELSERIAKKLKDCKRSVIRRRNFLPIFRRPGPPP